MKSYIALMRKDPDSDYGVDFPDFPGCVTAGTTMEEARWMAQEALELYAECLAEKEENFPEPSSLDVILNEPENRDGLVVPFLVTLPAKKARAKRINITLPENVLKKVDDYVNESREVKNRSDFLGAAAMEYIRGQKSGRPKPKILRRKSPKKMNRTTPA